METGSDEDRGHLTKRIHQALLQQEHLKGVNEVLEVNEEIIEMVVLITDEIIVEYKIKRRII